MKLKIFFGTLIMAFAMCISFSSCSSDDDDSGNSNVIGNTYVYYEVTTDYDGMPEEDKITLKFTSSSTCYVKQSGYAYIWDGGYKKDTWNRSGECNYSVSGSKITIINPPFMSSNLVLTNHGKYLKGNGYTFYKE